MSKWPRVRLTEVAKLDRTIVSGAELPYIGLEDIEAGTGRIVGNLAPRTVKSSTFMFDDSHVLYGRLRPYLNKWTVPSFSGHCSTEIFPIRTSELLSRHYLAYWLSSAVTNRRIDATSRGARMPRANMDEVLRFEIPLPPLDEQKRIVAKLDASGALLDEIESLLERNQYALSALRDSFLTTRLQLNETEMVPLEKLATRVVVGFVGSTSQHYRDVGIPFLRTQNVTKDGLDLSTVKYVTEEFHTANRKSQLVADDVLISRVISSRVNVGVVPEVLGPANCANVVIVTPGSGINPEFLAAYVASPWGQSYLLDRKVGSAQLVVNTGIVKEWPIPSLTRNEQDEFVASWREFTSLLGMYISALGRREVLSHRLREKLVSNFLQGAA